MRSPTNSSASAAAKNRVKLPIDDAKEPLFRALTNHRAVVLEAPPGAGKTTRVPPWLLEEQICAANQKILVLEPRRVAARASAERVAAERGEKVGDVVGYRVRFDEKVSAKTRIEFITEGILTRRFRGDAFLDGVGAVILDEVHERSVHTDLALGFLRELLEVRDDLFVIAMSATLDGTRLSAFLHDAPIVRSEGRTFPLNISWAPARDDRWLEDRAAAGIFHLMTRGDDDGGDILAFLPGAGEIERTRQKLLARSLPGNADVFPLYGSLPFAAQEKALRVGPRRRVVLSTNLAETSLTVEGVTSVVDAGLRKVARHDPASGLDRLHVVKISQASAAQRAGRAGRTAPGRCYRLYTPAEHTAFSRFDAPELAEIDLAPVVLSLCAFAASDPARFALPDALPSARLAVAVDLLRMLGALDDEGFALTPRGEALADLPVHPRIGAVLLAGRANDLVLEAAAMAAVLSERDFLTRHAQQSMPSHDNDILYRAELLDERSPPRGLVDANAWSRAREVRKQLERLARAAPKSAAEKLPADIGRPLACLLLAGFPDRVCTRRPDDKGRGVMVGRTGVRLGAETGVRDAPLFVVASLFGGVPGAGEARVTQAAALDPEDLEAVSSHLVQREKAVSWDADREAVVVVDRVLFADLVLREHREGGGAGAAAAFSTRAAELVFENARPKIDEFLGTTSDSGQTLARIQFGAKHLASSTKEGEVWPTFDDAGKEALLRIGCEGKRSLAELRKVHFGSLALDQLPWRLRSILDDKAPEKIEVPSGSKISIDYTAAFGPTGVPVLAVRLQEIFGWDRTPNVAGVGVLMHLLAPNRRPVQVTKDLASFWDGLYDEVRKELRRRYPKHSWPDDPRTAPAQRRPPRRPRK